jgi:DNA modification methylase
MYGAIKAAKKLPKVIARLRKALSDIQKDYAKKPKASGKPGPSVQTGENITEGLLKKAKTPRQRQTIKWRAKDEKTKKAIENKLHENLKDLPTFSKSERAKYSYILGRDPKTSRTIARNSAKRNVGRPTLKKPAKKTVNKPPKQVVKKAVKKAAKKTAQSSLLFRRSQR